MVLYQYIHQYIHNQLTKTGRSGLALRLKMRHLLLQSMILGNEVTWKSFVNSGFSSTFTFNTLVYPTNAIFSSRHLDHLEGNLSCGRLQSLQLWVKVDASGTPEILINLWITLCGHNDQMRRWGWRVAATMVQRTRRAHWDTCGGSWGGESTSCTGLYWIHNRLHFESFSYNLHWWSFGHLLNWRTPLIVGTEDLKVKIYLQFSAATAYFILRRYEHRCFPLPAVICFQSELTSGATRSRSHLPLSCNPSPGLVVVRVSVWESLSWFIYHFFYKTKTRTKVITEIQKKAKQLIQIAGHKTLTTMSFTNQPTRRKMTTNNCDDLVTARPERKNFSVVTLRCRPAADLSLIIMTLAMMAANSTDF